MLTSGCLPLRCHVCLSLQATLQLHKQMQATEKTRLAEQQAAAAAAASAASTPQLAFAGANGAAVNGSYSEPRTPEGSATSSLDESSSSNNGSSNGHHVPVPVGAGSGDLHAVRLHGGATYSPSIPVENGNGHGSSGVPAEHSGSSGPSPVKEKVKLQ